MVAGKQAGGGGEGVRVAGAVGRCAQEGMVVGVKEEEGRAAE